MKATVGIITASFLLVPFLVFAQTSSGFNTPPTSSGGNTVNSSQIVTVQNPLGVNSVCGLIKKLLQAAIDIGIPVAILFIVYAGFKFVLARGNAEKLTEARRNFLWTVIGIAIFLGASLLATVVANTINAISSGSGQQQAVSCN